MPVTAAATATRLTAITPKQSGNTIRAITVATVERQRPLSLLATNATVAHVWRAMATTRTSAAAATGTLIRTAIKLPFAVTITTAVTLTRSRIYALVLSTSAHAGQAITSKFLTATQAATATLTTIKVSLRTLTTSQAQTGALNRQPRKTLTTGTQMTLPPIFHSVAPVATLARQQVAAITLNVTAFQATAVTLTRAVIGRTFTAVQTVAAVVNRRPGINLSGTAGSLVALTTQKAQRLLALVSQVTTAATVTRAIALTLLTSTAAVSELVKHVSATLMATVTAVATRGGALASLTLPAVQNATSTLTRAAARTLATSQSVASTLARAVTRTLTAVVVTVVTVIRLLIGIGASIPNLRALRTGWLATSNVGGRIRASVRGQLRRHDRGGDL